MRLSRFVSSTIMLENRSSKLSGETTPEIGDILNIKGFIRSQETVPTEKPKSFSDQLVLVSGGGSTRAYFYDIAALAWRFTALS